MMNSKFAETTVGLLIIIGVLALAFLAFKVSGLESLFGGSSYDISANFDNIGDLRVRAPVTIGGVKIGDVQGITLDPKSLQAIVTLQINDRYQEIPDDSEASIFTQGLLGSNYINITPGTSEHNLKNNGQIRFTHSALILENLIGQLLFNMNKKSE